ncbi:MAG: FAD:protein FMN transferase [Gammaproteobacteria bacterium]|nr:FAD:protein FMN transferase [Gammaproteobacteria bacterium]MDH3372068.1 FAD:protein FMN transferase [Gammaproteobacteria bacterium]MDH3407865.1 FAD:protein FMN transferase [Gammaproteobacteria bacterium]MDH3551523.1 FAD:protein FMN transferase [Gammaproteobacteria bacterium]
MRALIVFAIISLCTACAEAPGAIELNGNTMGTQFSVKLAGVDVDAASLQQDIEASFEDVETMMSTYRPDSEISRFNSNATTAWQDVSAEFCKSVAAALALSAETGGLFDITVGPLVNLWGFGPGDIVDEPPADERIAAMLESVGYEHLQADCARPALRKDIVELVLDMSAFGKGYAVDRVADWLEDAGFQNYLVEVGGELRLRGTNASGEKWAIGIEFPFTDQRRPYTVVRLSDTAVATSGDYRNYFEADGKRYSHTIDTRTGRPITHSLASVTVVDSSGYRADALATALLVMGPEAGMQLAMKENLAVLFLLRSETGIDERSSPAFEQLRSS